MYIKKIKKKKEEEISYSYRYYRVSSGHSRPLPVSSLTLTRNARVTDVTHHGKASKKRPAYKRTKQNGSLPTQQAF